MMHAGRFDTLTGFPEAAGRRASAILFLIPEEPEGKLMQPHFESLFHFNTSDLALSKGIYFCLGDL